MTNRHLLLSFGALLKEFRTRRRLTQQQLATSVGVHRNAISRWEQGDFLPKQKGIVLELARRLSLDDQECRRLLEASLTALVPFWLVPLPRNPFFTGREEILATLHRQLGAEQVIALTQTSALHGLGGVGKTQIALEYAYRHALEYRAVFWIAAETDEQVVASFQRIAEVLALPEQRDPDQHRLIATVQRWLATQSGWLLIWDNIKDRDLLERFLPSMRAGTILLTTRNAAPGARAQGIDVPPMAQEEGVLFLLRRARVLEQAGGEKSEHMTQLAQRLPADYLAASTLVRHMGGLPLALDQAGAYREETECSLSEYLQHYERYQARLLGRRGNVGTDHPASVTTTFRLAFEQVEREHHVAAVMRVCALLHAEAIPEELFIEGAPHLGPELAQLLADPLAFDHIVAVLRSLSLVQRHPVARTLSLHRLVQAVVRDGMSAQEHTVWVQRLLAVLNALFPTDGAEVHAWERCERLLVHVLTVAEAASDHDAGSQHLVEVLGKTADYLHERAQYERAEQVYQQAIHVGERHLGPDHPGLAPALSGLAFLWGEQGHYPQAEVLGMRALLLSEQALGPAHPQVAAALTTLGVLFTEQGKYAQAGPLLRRALAIQKETLGPDHPHRATTLNRLALLSWRQGNGAQAEPLFQQALAIWQQVYGPASLQVAHPLYNLALLYWKQGRYTQAESLFAQAHTIWEQAYGRGHPLVAYALRGLGLLAAEQGKYGQAEALFAQELQIWQQTWGSEHSQVALTLLNLGWTKVELEKDEQAEPLLQRALHIEEQAGGSEYPRMVCPLNHLAHLYAKHGKEEQAEAFFRRAIRLWEQSQEPGDTNVATALAGLGSLLLAQGKDEQAREQVQRALALQEQQGPYHPEMAYILHTLATVLQKQGKLNEAHACAERALTIRSQVFGNDHPKTVATRRLSSLIAQEREGTEQEDPTQRDAKASQDQFGKAPCSASASVSPHETTTVFPASDDLFQGFLVACCELHPLAWCTIHELWHTYEHWTATEQGHIPLPRRVFAAQLKAQGCRVDRTNTARIWRGIRLVKEESVTKVTKQ